MTWRYIIDTYQIRGLFAIKYATIVKKKQSKTAGFFLRFHIFKSGVSYSSGPVITKCGFWWFQKLTQVFIFHIRHVLVLYHTCFRFSAYLADPTPKNQQTCVYISFRSGFFQSLCNIVVLYIKLFSLKRRYYWCPSLQYELLGFLGIRQNVVF